MRREVIKKFLIWFCVGVIPGVIFFHYYVGLPLDMDLFRLIVIASFACLNLIYLTLLLKKIDMVVAVAFGCTFWFAGFIYMQARQDIEPQTKFIHIILVLAGITIVVRLLLKKALHDKLRQK